MCPLCAATIAIVTAGVASTGILGLAAAKTVRSKHGMQQEVGKPTQSTNSQENNQERSCDDNQLD